eukprot:symbB.v1.2.006848.t1/scaffold408.1/size210514/6
MQVVFLQPNVFSSAAAVSAMEKCQQWRFALAIAADDVMSKNQVSVNAAISACEKRSMWRMAMELLEAPQAANVLALSSMLSALAQAIRWQDALAMLQRFEMFQVTPNEVSYSAVITACEKVGHWQMSMALLKEMLEKNLQPDVFAHNAALAACLRAVEKKSSAVPVRPAVKGARGFVWSWGNGAEFVSPGRGRAWR